MFKTTKSKVIFVIIFSALCIAITILLILYNNIDIEEKEITEELSTNNIKEDIQSIDLKGTYNQNDINIEEKIYTGEKIEVKYCEISGLKNKTIQDKINKEIEREALNSYKEKIKDLNEVVNISIDVYNSANFANTISFDVTYYAKIDNDTDDFYQGAKGINYDLTTGEEITIDKLFTQGAPIENILRKSIYYSLVQIHAEESLTGDLIINDYGEIEEDIVEIINLYKKGEITEFFYTPRYIYIFYDEEKNITIDMQDIPEYIAIYNKYLTDESIYEKNDIGLKKLYTLSDSHRDVYYYSNYQNEKNYFIDISLDYQSSDDDKFGKNLVQEKIRNIEIEIQKIKQLSIQNPNNFYILNYYIQVYTGEEWSTKEILTNYYERGNSYEMTTHDFEENIRPIIMEYNRQNGEEGLPDYVYDFSELLKIEPQNIREIYNPKTGEKVVI